MRIHLPGSSHLSRLVLHEMSEVRQVGKEKFRSDGGPLT